MKTENRLRSLHTFATPIQPAPAGTGDAYESPTISGFIRRAALDGSSEDNSPLQSEPALRLQPKLMLAVLSYCYASGVYASAEIENRLWQDEAFLSRFNHQLPTAPRIRQFRRQHRPQIFAVIESALRAHNQRTSEPAASSHDTPDPVAAAAAALEHAAIADSLDEA